VALRTDMPLVRRDVEEQLRAAFFRARQSRRETSRVIGPRSELPFHLDDEVAQLLGEVVIGMSWVL